MAEHGPRDSDSPSESLFRRWAKRQGVERPFEALVRMDAASRSQIAEQLGIDLKTAWSDAVLNSNCDLWVSEQPDQTPALEIEAEAAIIIGMNIEGIQARSHDTLHKLNLFAGNNTWGEILSAVIREFRIPLSYEGYLTAEEREAAIYEWVADKAIEQMSSDEKAEIEKLLVTEPEVAESLKRAGFGPSGAKLAASGVFKMAARSGFRTYTTAAKVAGFLNRRVGTKLVMSSVSAGLKIALRAVNTALWVWLVKDVLDLILDSSRGRLVGVICEIHQFYLLERLWDPLESTCRHASLSIL